MFKRLTCSFCGRSAAEVAKLVAGPKVHICDRCVAIASRIMEQHPDATPPAAGAPKFFERLRARIRALGSSARRRRGLERSAAPA
jgi:hypothetical protein